MKQLSRAALGIVLVVAIAITSPLEASIADTFERTIVVRATVVEIKGTTQYNTALLRVDHVYSGQLMPVGSTFQDRSAFQTSTGHEVWPALAANQNGLWLLQAGAEGYVRKQRGLGIKWPVRSGIEPRYEQVLRLAEAIETVWHAKTEKERIDLLKGYAQSDVPEVSVGAIELLAEGAPDELAKLTKDVNLRVLPLRAQIALDQSMTKLDAEQWRTSAQRSRLFNTWRERSAENDNDAILVLTRLDGGIQRKEFTALEVWSFLAPLIKSANATPSVRNRAVHIMRWIVNDSQVHDKAFDLLANILEGEADSQLNFAAAQTLSQFEKLSDEQRARVSVLLDNYRAKSALETERYSPLKQIPPLLEKALDGGDKK